MAPARAVVSAKVRLHATAKEYAKDWEAVRRGTPDLGLAEGLDCAREPVNAKGRVFVMESLWR